MNNSIWLANGTYLRLTSCTSINSKDYRLPKINKSNVISLLKRQSIVKK